MFEQLWQQYGTKVVVAALLLFINNGSQYVPGLTQHFFVWVQHKAASMKNEYAKGIVDRLLALVSQKVLMLEQTEIQYLKSQAAAGKLSIDQLPDLLLGVKKVAVNSVMTDAEVQGLWPLAEKLFSGKESLFNWLADAIEAEVSKLPPSGLQTPADLKLAAAITTAPATGGTTLSLPVRLASNHYCPICTPV